MIKDEFYHAEMRVANKGCLVQKDLVKYSWENNVCEEQKAEQWSDT